MNSDQGDIFIFYCSFAITYEIGRYSERVYSIFVSIRTGWGNVSYVDEGGILLQVALVNYMGLPAQKERTKWRLV